MAGSLKLLGTQVKEIWSHLGINQRVSLVLAVVATIGVIAGMVIWSSRPQYRMLYSGISLKDAGAMQEKLEEAKIKVSLRDSGTAIYVPAGDVYRGRILLASAGLPKDRSAGFELFEQPKFGLTDFAQQVNYQRALQGEIERTISAMGEIESSRVMLVIPRDKIFSTGPREKARASILINTRGGSSVSPALVQSIVHLVASSVPDLSPTDVTVTDQGGRLLTRAVSEEELIDNTGSQLETQQKLEGQLAKKAQDLLDAALGAGRSVVKVNAALDFSRREKRIENYDGQNKVVRTEFIQSENSTTPNRLEGGPAGIVQNIPVGNPAGGLEKQAMSESKKENVRTEYAIPSDVERVEQRGARISNLSVSVCVARGKAPRSQDDLRQIEDLVKNAVGVVQDETRKDTIKVSEMDFAVAPPVVEPAPTWGKAVHVAYQLKEPVAWLVALLAVWLIGRKIMRNMDIHGLEVKQDEAGIPVREAMAGRYAEAGHNARPHTESPPGSPEELAERNIGELHEIAEQNPKAIAAWIRSVAGSAG